MNIIQRIYEGAGEDGKDIRETLGVGFPSPDAALTNIKSHFEEDQEFSVKYNLNTKRFIVIPDGRDDLVYHIVAKKDEEIIDADNSNTE